GGAVAAFGRVAAAVLKYVSLSPGVDHFASLQRSTKEGNSCMRRYVQAAALSLAAGWLAQPNVVQAQLLPPPMATGVQIAYVAPTNPAHGPIFERLKKRQVLEHYKEFMSPLMLKTPLQISLQGCDGKINAWFDGSAKITYCYELVAELERV